MKHNSFRQFYEIYLVKDDKISRILNNSRRLMNRFRLSLQSQIAIVTSVIQLMEHRINHQVRNV